MSRTIASVATAVIALSVADLSHAQNDEAATETAEQQTPVDEEVIVRGKRTLFDLRNELEAAREHVWDIFNEINSHDDFDITCMDATRTGTRIEKRTCRPQYADAATSRAGKALARRIQLCAPADSPAYAACLEIAMQNGSAEAQAETGRIGNMDQRLDQEFRRLAQERPELARAILEFLAKDREYDEAAQSLRD